MGLELVNDGPVTVAPRHRHADTEARGDDATDTTTWALHLGRARRPAGPSTVGSSGYREPARRLHSGWSRRSRYQLAEAESPPWTSRNSADARAPMAHHRGHVHARLVASAALSTHADPAVPVQGPGLHLRPTPAAGASTPTPRACSPPSGCSPTPTLATSRELMQRVIARLDLNLTPAQLAAKISSRRRPGHRDHRRSRCRTRAPASPSRSPRPSPRSSPATSASSRPRRHGAGADQGHRRGRRRRTTPAR